MFNQNMQIVRLEFIETGTYNQQYIRPYETNLNNQVVAQINEATAGGSNINAISLAGVAGNFLRPKAMVVNADRIDIQNGWDMKRFRFIAEIHYPSMHGGRLIQYVTGYTNHAGVSTLTHAIDPLMTLHFDNSILMQEIMEQTPMGPRIYRRPTSVSQILSAGNYYQNFGHNLGIGSPIRLQRPEDVFSSIASRYTYGAGDGGMTDFRQSFLQNAQLKMSYRQNGVISNYLARTMDSQATANANSEYDAQVEELANAAAARAAEQSVAKDNFLSWLLERGLLNDGASVTWGELVSQAPQADQVAKFFVQGQAQMMEPTHQTGSTENWNVASNETIMASILSQSLPSVMLDCMVTKMWARFSNRIVNPAALAGNHSQHTVAFMNRPPMGLMEDMTSMYPMLVDAIQRRVLPDATMDGMWSYDITVSVDVFGESYYDISLEGNPTIRYCTPTFADTLFAPVVTTNPAALTSMSSDIDMLLNTVSLRPASQPAAPIIESPYGF